jgi:hypothetical protein
MISIFEMRTLVPQAGPLAMQPVPEKSVAGETP